MPATANDLESLLRRLSLPTKAKLTPKESTESTVEAPARQATAFQASPLSTSAPPTPLPQVKRPTVLGPENGKSAESPTSESGSLAKLASGTTIADNKKAEFIPVAARSLDEAGLSEGEVSALILRFLLQRVTDTGYRISGQLGLRFNIIEAVLRQLKADKLCVYKNAVTGGDYLYELTEQGRERGRSLALQCTYIGAAPVPLAQYVESVKAQSLAFRRPSLAQIAIAFADLKMPDALLSSVAQAIHSGRGMFLYGMAGNGKTSIAERITRAFGDSIWVPKAITSAGEIIRLYDPNRHELMPTIEPGAPSNGSVSGSQGEIDGRWVRIRRPTVVAGGELRMENLEITTIRKSGIGEAPLQMKSNCGTLLIDDFGRQRMSTDELLNRWIVPLEQRHDFLQLESGRTIQVPFDQLLIFSTNLEPRDLVDEAFLRRIPYKIEVKNPEESQFRQLFLELSKQMNLACNESTVEHLLEKHYRNVGRQMRFCQPRDLLRQIENRCTVHELPREVTCEALDQAAENYFGIM